MARDATVKERDKEVRICRVMYQEVRNANKKKKTGGSTRETRKTETVTGGWSKEGPPAREQFGNRAGWTRGREDRRAEGAARGRSAIWARRTLAAPLEPGTRGSPA